MTIIEALKNNDNNDIRITFYDRWLIWDGNEFVIYEHKKYQHGSKVIGRTESEERAVDILLNYKE